MKRQELVSNSELVAINSKRHKKLSLKGEAFSAGVKFKRTSHPLMNLQRQFGNQFVQRQQKLARQSETEVAVAQRKLEKSAFGMPAQRQQGREEEEELQMKANPTVLQRQGMEEEEPLQGKFESVQRQEPEEEDELLQGKFATHDAPAQFQDEVGEAENPTGLPRPLKAGLEALSGMELSSVRVHYNSSKPAELNALAYTQGQDIHVGPGQERHLPHEGWHAVQQIEERVKPTMQVNGVSVNDDAGLEREADVMGTKALKITRGSIKQPRSYYHGTMSLKREVQTNGESEVTGETVGASEGKERLNFLSTPQGMIMQRSPGTAGGRDSFVLPTKKRTELLRITGGRIITSAGYYRTALLAVQIKVGRMLKAQKDAANIIFEIALGFLMPGLGRLLGKGLAALAQKIPVSASTTSYRVALALLDEKQIQGIFVKATDIGRKAAKTMVDSELKSITGNAKFEAYFEALKKSAAKGFDVLNNNLSTKKNNELGVIFVSYDPTKEAFENEIESLVLKFKEQIKPIGEKTDSGRYGTKKARWIEGSKRKALALTGEGRYFNVGSGPRFIRWISPEVKDLAIAETKSINFGRIPTVHYSGLERGSKPTIAPNLLDSDTISQALRDKIVVEEKN